MAEAKIVKPGAKVSATQESDAQAEDTFSYRLADNSLVVCGKPQGVLKMRLRHITTEDMRRDAELTAIATAFLCIRTINGRPPVLRTEKEFDALLNRFGSDEAVDEFMAKYQELTNPGVAKILNEVLAEATEEHLSASEIEDRVTERVMRLELERRKQVKD